MSDTAHKAASQVDKNIRKFQPRKTSPINVLSKQETLPMIDRTQDLVRNNGVASGALETIVDNVVGTGLRLNATVDHVLLGISKGEADDLGKVIEAHFRAYANSTDIDARKQWNFATLTQLVLKTELQSGEVFALPYWRKKGNEKFKTSFLVIEPEHVCNPNGVDNTAKLKDGVRINEIGAPVGYYVAKRHPYENNDYYSLIEGENTWQYVPLTTEFGRKRIIHYFTPNRTGGLRGKPFLSNSLKRFSMLDNYEESELQAAVVNAMIAAIVETMSDAAPEDVKEMFGSFTNYLDEQAEQDYSLNNGKVLHTLPGEKVHSFDTKRPNAQFADFVDGVLKHIAAGVNLPIELLTKDFRDSNYSSVRSALLEAWRTFKRKRQHIATYWANEVYALWFEEAVSSGVLPINLNDFYKNKEAYLRCEWIGPGKGWIDPVKEAQGSKLRIESGLSTYTQECAEQGLDFNEVVENKVREIKHMKETAEKEGLTLGEVMPALNETLLKAEGTKDSNKKDDKE